MKRYNPMPGHMMVEQRDGDWGFMLDVEREYIPRPDPEEARKAVDELIEAVREQARAWLVEHPDSECHAKNSARVAAARAEIVEEE